MDRRIRTLPAGRLSRIDRRIAETLLKNWDQVMFLSSNQPSSRQACEALVTRYAEQKQSSSGYERRS